MQSRTCNASSSGVSTTPRAICLRTFKLTIASRCQNLSSSRTHAVMKNAEDVMNIACNWIQLDPDEETKLQVSHLVENGDIQTLHELLGQRLEFGTAGLRGKMGPGYNRMNTLVVMQTAQGLFRYLQQEVPELLSIGGIVVGHDARHGSLSFARITAQVFMSKGIKVHLFPKVVPTPFVTAGVAVHNAAAGVMVTASHNPKEYNGYKVYWGNGCQIIPPHDEGIASAILQELQPWTNVAVPDDWDQIVKSPLLLDPTEIVAEEYYRRLKNLCYRGETLNASASPIVYTPLHGVGATYVKRAFQVMGLPTPLLVESQEQPDPDFPTVDFPNPEEGKGTWQQAFEKGERTSSMLLLANDPDADRLAAAERCTSSPLSGSCGSWRTFTGNEIGILLADWIWQNEVSQSQPDAAKKSRYAMLSSAVSSQMLSALAAAEGLHWEETLTGFKWLGNRALDLECSGKQVLFAFEEAIGFMLGAMFKDKDGVAAAAVFAELAASLYAEGKTVASHLVDLSQRYGSFVYRASYFIADQPSKSKAVFEHLRGTIGQYPKAVGGVPVLSVRDMGMGIDTQQPDGIPVLPWREGDMMLTFRLEGGACITLRASGTEPKLKYYLEVSGSDVEALKSTADLLEQAVADEIIQYKERGLTRPPEC
ncbi:hypothetical protein CEUSTIGMA_g3344.t1 [Chlamydomonas eustigma]|uniref:phosphoglucomutase (alpha-D-glucose-1,6-bisphosphate-dependent) n=1 Tax=Chlamydomonas eustigma TaxID=1157962 RepID=A0A250WYJ4_9CHLO|nr:hypothetical protein CEUSTIGMA_g3344.t1 [Chlamydomonas eustigma]|eukprot:GAX75901.1 hypothetical protein CEUSTIGMA_g3344.t1 [Chlamydomonas eustigma]